MFYVRYFGALVYDGMVLAALFIIFTALCLLYRHGVAIPPGAIAYQLSLLFIIYGYYFQSYRHGGQTIGMRAWHLKIVSLATHLNKKQILARLLLVFPAYIFSILRIKNPMRLLKGWTKSQIIQV